MLIVAVNQYEYEAIRLGQAHGATSQTNPKRPEGDEFSVQ